MSGRDAHEDELTRRRAARATSARAAEGEAPAEEDEELKLGWKDILALIIAAYQILFPILLTMVAVMGIVWLIFRFYFGRGL